MRCAVAIDNGQTTHLVVGHGAERPVNVVIGMAGEDGSGGDFSDGQTPRQPVSCSERNADVAVGHNAKSLLLSSTTGNTP